ncbi:hypothetical protein PR048_025257 [Dryococelus australis]|uniref:Uncharacterized protein n=1 Tax=Dryococelus australis TaxID=614101 RepID=A0ABQ9GQX3_9NEOP|nr:hypothetical protein PR048_025257 [Dryococelus australis]
MADETKDVSKVEQLAILIRYVDCEDWKIKERAIGLHHWKYCRLDLKYCVGQCYDDANVMIGWANGVQARVKHQAPHAIYFHYHAHCLNLVLVHSLSVIEETKDFSTLQTIYCFISNSSVRHELFLEAQRKLKQPVMCLERFVPTQWFCWFSAVSKILKNFEAILIGRKHWHPSSNGAIVLHFYSIWKGAIPRNIRGEEKAKTLANNSNIEWDAVAKRKRAITSCLADREVSTSVGQMERNTRSIYLNIVDTVKHEFAR